MIKNLAFSFVFKKKTKYFHRNYELWSVRLLNLLNEKINQCIKVKMRVSNIVEDLALIFDYCTTKNEIAFKMFDRTKNRNKKHVDDFLYRVFRINLKVLSLNFVEDTNIDQSDWIVKENYKKIFVTTYKRCNNVKTTLL